MSPSLSASIHLHPPNSSSTRVASRTYLIYFVTGNPGLIEYYRLFLSHLYALLSITKSPSVIEFQVYGRSLSGFEVGAASPSTGLKGPPPYTLEQQIVESERCLLELVKGLKQQGKQDVQVILMGHSVGSYILLEIVRRVKAHEGSRANIAGGICLFPTVVDIARSESGLVATVRRVLSTHSDNAIPCHHIYQLPA